jgi:hypothetical protein
VRFSAKFKLVVNLNTGNSRHLAVPLTLSTRADEVVE